MYKAQSPNKAIFFVKNSLNRQLGAWLPAPPSFYDPEIRIMLELWSRVMLRLVAMFMFLSLRCTF